MLAVVVVADTDLTVKIPDTSSLETAQGLAALQPGTVPGQVLAVQMLFLGMIQTKRSRRVLVFAVEASRVSLEVLAHARFGLTTEFHGAALIDSAYH